MIIRSVLEFAHRLVSRTLEVGDLAVDATVGNGHDTLFLARQVGPEGQVVGFDVQSEAIEATRRRVQSEMSEAALRLVHSGHENMPEHLDESDHGTVGGVMFNLGYLPGGDHSFTTTPETTRQALDHSAPLIRSGGIITIVAYPGHEGGTRETEMVEKWTSSLPQHTFRALSYQFVNQASDPPRLFAVEKRGEEE